MQRLKNEIRDKSENAPGAEKPHLVQGELLAEVAPGIFRPLVPPIDIPRYVIARLTPTADGNYRLTPAREWTGWIKITDVAADDTLPNVSRQTLRRLILAGFIDGAQLIPGCWFVKLESLIDHITRTASEDPENSWWTPARRQAYAAAR